jgi:4-amino-4-deoxy-L-arabinose transferase-like glycosyltransferase
VAGPPKLGRRLVQLAIAGAALLVSAGWWVALVTLWPASSRPYVGGTDDNSILGLIFGYNGLGRVFGGDGNPGGSATGFGGGAGGGPGRGFGGTPGWLRLFNDLNGGQIAWLLPFALAGLAAGLWLTRRAARTDRARAGWLLWGGWTLTCAAVFSQAEGIFHPYYTVQLAPGVAALAGAGGPALWRLGRTGTGAVRTLLRLALPAAIVVTAGVAVMLLGRTSGYYSWLTPVVVVAAALAAGGLWLAWHLRSRVVVLGASALAAVALLAGPAAYSVSTIGNSAIGSIVAAGPVAGGAGAGFGGGGRGGSAVDEGLVSYLEANRGDAEYLVATFGSQSAAPLIIATGEPVIAIGGFTGSDPAPTLAEFQQMVADGEVRYVLVTGGGGGAFGGPGGGGSGGDIGSWAASAGTVVDASAYGGSSTAGTLYDLSGAA